MLLPVQKLSAHKQHYYEGSQIQDIGLVSHVRVSMAPDGGISRVRFWGTRQLASL
jgi:allantoicase